MQKYYEPFNTCWEQKFFCTNPKNNLFIHNELILLNIKKQILYNILTECTSCKRIRAQHFESIQYLKILSKNNLTF